MNKSLDQAIIEQNLHWDAGAYEHLFKRLHDIYPARAIFRSDRMSFFARSDLKI